MFFFFIRAYSHTIGARESYMYQNLVKFKVNVFTCVSNPGDCNHSDVIVKSVRIVVRVDFDIRCNDTCAPEENVGGTEDHGEFRRLVNAVSPAMRSGYQACVRKQ